MSSQLRSEKPIQNLRLAGLVGEVALGDPMIAGDLAIVPLFLENGHGGEPPVLLDEAVARGDVKIEEIGGGTVPEIALENGGKDPVLILEGDHLIGAKQNRAVWVTILVGAKSRIILPVSCVELGRWSFRTRRFTTSDHRMSARMRGASSGELSRSLRSGRGYRVSQAAVWDRVARMSSELGASSPTDSYDEVLTTSARRVRAPRETFPLAPGQAGLVALASGRLAGIELAGSADVFAKVYRRILDSYIFDAVAMGLDLGAGPRRNGGLRTGTGEGSGENLEEERSGSERSGGRVGDDGGREEVAHAARHWLSRLMAAVGARRTGDPRPEPRAGSEGSPEEVGGAPQQSGAQAHDDWDREGVSDTARQWVSRLQAAEADTRPSIGLGRDVRYETPELVGGGLEHEGRLVYLTAYAAARN